MVTVAALEVEAAISNNTRMKKSQSNEKNFDIRTFSPFQLVSEGRARAARISELQKRGDRET